MTADRKAEMAISASYSLRGSQFRLCRTGSE